MINIHRLKIISKYFKDIVNGKKTFELRKLDREFNVGDLICLHGLDGVNLTGALCFANVTYILKDIPEYGLMDGYGILGIEVVRKIIY